MHQFKSKHSLNMQKDSPCVKVFLTSCMFQVFLILPIWNFLLLTAFHGFSFKGRILKVLEVQCKKCIHTTISYQ